MDKVRLREARLEDIPGIWKICSLLFNEFRGSAYQDFYDLCVHRWRDNPARTPEHVFGWVLEVPDKGIVGFLGLVPMKVKIGNKYVMAASGTSWAVDTPYRSHSLYLYKEFMSWGDRNLLFDTTAGEIANKFHAHLKRGMKKIPLADFGETFQWILRPEVLVERKLKELAANKKGLGLIYCPLAVKLGAFFGRVRFLRNSQIRFKCDKLTVELIDSFTDEFDRFWEDNKRDYGITIVRNKEFLNWRHIKIPKFAGRSFVFACRDNGRLAGYIAITKRGYANSRPGHFVVTDIFYPLSRREVIRNLMNYAFTFAKDNGASTFEMSGFNPIIMNEVRDQRPRIFNSLNWTYWYKAPTSETLEACRTGTWWPSGVDGDLNL